MNMSFIDSLMDLVDGPMVEMAARSSGSHCPTGNKSSGVAKSRQEFSANSPKQGKKEACSFTCSRDSRQGFSA